MDPTINTNQLTSDCLAVLTKELPTDCRSEIFKHLTLQCLSSLSSVCNELSEKITPLVWREMIGKCFALGVNEYNTYFEHDVENIELPLNIHQEIKDLFKFSVVKGVNKAPILGLIDPSLTLKKIGELVNQHLNGSKNGYDHLSPEFIAEDGEGKDNALSKKPYWVLLMNGVIGRDKKFDHQKALVEDLKKDGLSIYQVPTKEEAVTCLYLKFLVSQTCEFTSGTYTRTQNIVGKCKACIGNFAPSGLHVFIYNFSHLSTGIAPLRRFF